MIVATVATKQKLSALVNIVNAPNLNSVVKMENAYRRDGVVITRTIVEIIRMN